MRMMAHGSKQQGMVNQKVPINLREAARPGATMHLQCASRGGLLSCRRLSLKEGRPRGPVEAITGRTAGLTLFLGTSPPKG